MIVLPGGDPVPLPPPDLPFGPLRDELGADLHFFPSPFAPLGLPLPVASLGCAYTHVPAPYLAQLPLLPGETDLRIAVLVVASALAAAIFLLPCWMCGAQI